MVVVAHITEAVKVALNDSATYSDDKNMWSYLGQQEYSGKTVKAYGTSYTTMTEEQIESGTKDATDTAWRIHGALVDWTGKVDTKASFALTIESDVLMRLRLGPPRWWSGWQVTLRLGEARLAGLR